MRMFVRFILVFFLSIVYSEPVAASNSDFSSRDVPLDKKWTITFSEDLDRNSVNYENFKVTDIYGNEVNILVTMDYNQPNKVTIQALEPYKYDSEYFLSVSGDVKSQSGRFNKPTIMQFKTLKNPNFGDLSNIKTPSDLMEYLNTNYSVIDTPTGKWELNHTYQGSVNANAKLILRTKWSGGSPYTLHYDAENLEILEYGRQITKEEKELTKQILRELQSKVATITMSVFPNAYVEGGFYSGGYKYPNLQIGYWSTKFLSWKNYYGSAYDESNNVREFHWNPEVDDYNFVLNDTIKKIYVVDEKNARKVAYEDWDKKIIIKKGEKIKFRFDQDVDSNLSYYEIGLSYYYSDYSNKEIINIDEKGNIIGNKVGQQSISVSYRRDPYVNHYFTVIVEE